MCQIMWKISLGKESLICAGQILTNRNIRLQAPRRDTSVRQGQDLYRMIVWGCSSGFFLQLFKKLMGFFEFIFCTGAMAFPSINNLLLEFYCKSIATQNKRQIIFIISTLMSQIKRGRGDLLKPHFMIFYFLFYFFLGG